MGKAKRLSYGFFGLLMMICSVLMVRFPKYGYLFALGVLELTLIAYGIRQLMFYLLMARHMVGGIRIFYQSVLVLDAGLFALSLHDMPRAYVMMYLVGSMLVSGVLNAARARETRRQGSTHWKYAMFTGLVKIVLSFVCMFYISSETLITIIYSAGLFYAGVARIVNASRQTAIVYIP